MLAHILSEGYGDSEFTRLSDTSNEVVTDTLQERNEDVPKPSTQDRLDKVSIDKGSIDKESIDKNSIKIYSPAPQDVLFNVYQSFLLQNGRQYQDTYKPCKLWKISRQ